MVFTTTITQKGQITLPVDFRRKYGLKVREKVMVEDTGEGLMIRKPKNFLDLAGSIKVPKHLKGLSDEEIERRVTEARVKEYKKEYGIG